MSAISYLTNLVTQALDKLNLIETNSKKAEELPFQGTLDPNSKIAVSRSGVAEHINVQQIITAVGSVNHNHLISVGAISYDEVSGNLTIAAIVEAMINSITVSKNTDSVFPITLAASGLIRKDVFYINSSGQVLVISDPEGAVATTPSLPINTVYITDIIVTDSEVGTPAPPLIGDAFVKKLSSGAISSLISGSEVSFPLPADGKTFLVFNNPALTSLAGFSLADIISAGGEVPEEGKEFYIVNNKNTSLTLQYLNTSDSNNRPFYFWVDADIVIPEFEFLRVKYFASGIKDLDRSWVTATSTPFSGLTGSPEDNTALAAALGEKEDTENKKTDLESNKTSNTFYASCKAIVDWINTRFQAILVSGTNIKTFYSQTILGSGDISKQITVVGNVTLDNTYNGKIVKIKANATITVPTGLADEFNCLPRTYSGCTGTFVASGITFDAPTGLILKPNKSASLFKDGSIETFVLTGETSTS